MKSIISAVWFFVKARERSIAILSWLFLWMVLLFDLGVFTLGLSVGDGPYFIAALILFFVATDIIFGIGLLLVGNKEYGFLGGIFVLEVEEGWTDQLVF